MNTSAYLTGYNWKTAEKVSVKSIGDMMLGQLKQIQESPSWRMAGHLPAGGVLLGGGLGAFLTRYFSSAKTRKNRKKLLKRMLLGGLAGAGGGYLAGAHLRYRIRAPKIHGLVREILQDPVYRIQGPVFREKEVEKKIREYLESVPKKLPKELPVKLPEQLRIPREEIGESVV